MPLLEVQEDLIRRLLERQRASRRALPRPRLRRRRDERARARAVGRTPRPCWSTSPSRCSSAPSAALGAHVGRWQRGPRRPRRPRRGATALPGGAYDAVVSGLAIHHLPAERKRELFAELFELLEPGGDVREHGLRADRRARCEGLFDEQMIANAIARRARERRRAARDEQVSAELLDGRRRRPARHRRGPAAVAARGRLRAGRSALQVGRGRHLRRRQAQRR